MNDNLTCEVQTASAEETKRVGAQLAERLRPGDVVVLNGDLGAGKTQFVQGVAEALGVQGPGTSPTFNILLAYEGRLPLNHFDLYRLDSADELDDIGYWEVLEDDGATFIEWGDKFPEAMPDDYLEIRLSTGGAGVRTIAMRAHGPASEHLLIRR